MYNDALSASKYIEAMFHPQEGNPYKRIKGNNKCLIEHFKQRLKFERGK